MVPREDGWEVRREAQRDSSHHDRKSDAMDAARDTARRDRVEVIEHRRDGPIRDTDGSHRSRSVDAGNS